MAFGLILEIDGHKYKLLKYNRRFNQKGYCMVLPFLSDMKENDIASADCRMTKRGPKACKQDFMNIAAEKSKQFSYGDCRTDYVGLESLDIAAKGATVRANRKRHYWGSLTAYYPAENPQYRIFVIMEQNIYNGTYYGVPLCAPVVARIIKSLNN